MLPRRTVPLAARNMQGVSSLIVWVGYAAPSDEALSSKSLNLVVFGARRGPSVRAADPRDVTVLGFCPVPAGDPHRRRAHMSSGHPGRSASPGDPVDRSTRDP